MDAELQRAAVGRLANKVERGILSHDVIDREQPPAVRGGRYEWRGGAGVNGLERQSRRNVELETFEPHGVDMPAEDGEQAQVHGEPRGGNVGRQVRPATQPDRQLVAGQLEGGDDLNVERAQGDVAIEGVGECVDKPWPERALAQYDDGDAQQHNPGADAGRQHPPGVFLSYQRHLQQDSS